MGRQRPDCGRRESGFGKILQNQVLTSVKLQLLWQPGIRPDSARARRRRPQRRQGPARGSVRLNAAVSEQLSVTSQGHGMCASQWLSLIAFKFVDLISPGATGTGPGMPELEIRAARPASATAGPGPGARAEHQQTHF